MSKIYFINDKNTIYNVNFYKQMEIVYIEFINNMPEDDILSSGFNIVNEHNGIVMGDYSDYTTIYRKLDNTVELSNDGSVYITPVIPEPIIPEPYVPNEEKLQEKFENEKKYKIMELSDYCQSMGFHPRLY